MRHHNVTKRDKNENQKDRIFLIKKQSVGWLQREIAIKDSFCHRFVSSRGSLIKVNKGFELITPGITQW